MQLGQISLCDRIGYNIKSDDDKDRILRELEANFGVKVIRRHHERFDEARHVPDIKSRPHLISVRTNGNPYFLYLTRLNFLNQCILIDKKVQQGYFYPRMILVRLWFDDHLFENTLFEGEMVKQNDGSWTFLLNDLLALGNRHTSDGNLLQRHRMLQRILERHFVPDDVNICRLRVKRYFGCDSLRRMLTDFVPTLPYSCRGVYFTPVFGRSFLHVPPKLLNFDDSLVKKVVRTNYKGTADFLLMSDRSKFEHEDNMKRRPEQQQQPQQQQHPTTAISPRLSKFSGGAEGDENHLRTFWVRHTRLPDVYELFKTPADIGKGSSAALTACVPSLELSRALRDAFLFTGVTEVVPMPCTLHPKFQKWMPIVPSV